MNESVVELKCHATQVLHNLKKNVCMIILEKEHNPDNI